MCCTGMAQSRGQHTLRGNNRLQRQFSTQQNVGFGPTFAQTGPNEMEPVGMEPVGMEPNETEPNETKPNETKPNETKPTIRRPARSQQPNVYLEPKWLR